MAEGARPESVYTRKCIEGSNPLSPPNSKRKPGFASVLFAWCTAERARSLDRVRQNACVLDRQRRPAGERSESSPLTAKLKRKPGFASGLFAWCTDERASIFPLCGSDPHYRRLSTNFTADFLTHSWHVPCRSPQFSAKCARLERTNKNTEIILDRIGPTPYSSAPLQR